MSDTQDNGYESGSLTLPGAVGMGTGVMIGAGIFALTGQIAELAGGWFPVVFLAAALVAGFSAYSYVKLSNHDPSAGGIAMYLKKAYGQGTVTAGMALLMYFSMVINESLVARTFGHYVMQLFAGPDPQSATGGGSIFTGQWKIPALAVGLLLVVFLVNVAANKFIDKFQLVMAVLKILGIVVFAGAGLWVSGLAWDSFTGAAGDADASGQGDEAGWVGIVASLALGILSYKGFTTGGEKGVRSIYPRPAAAGLAAAGCCPGPDDRPSLAPTLTSRKDGRA